MFDKPVTTSPFDDSVAHPTFAQIRGDHINNDVSFISTMRALLMNRIGEEDEIDLALSSSSYSTYTVTNNPPGDVIKAMLGCEQIYKHNLFQIHSFNTGAMGSDASFMMDFIEAELPNTFVNFERVEKVTTFFSKMFRVLCYVSPATKTTLFFIQDLNYVKTHALQMAILPALPWYFNNDSALLPEEMDLIKSLQESTPDHYMECLHILADKYDLTRIRIKNLLEGVETKYLDGERIALEHQISDFMRTISDYNERIGRLYRDRDSCFSKLLGVKSKIASAAGESELVDYFMNNSRLYLDDVTGDTIYFSVADDITYYDPEMAERMIADTYGYIDENYSSRSKLSREDMKKLLTGVFIDERLHIKFCAEYSFRINGNVSGVTMCNDSSFKNCMKNPHIDQYHCLGGYEQTINEILEHHDYIGAIEQCVASCKSLNWGDSFVMNSFVNELYTTHSKIIRLPDGTYVEPKIAVKWLNENDKECDGEDE